MTDATTWETVIVRVIVAVEVRVVVEDVSATTRRGRRRSVEIVGNFISIDLAVNPVSNDLRRDDRISYRWDEI